MRRCSRDWAVSILTVAALGLALACLFDASQAIWAAPEGGPACQLLPTAPPVTSRPIWPAATATGTPVAPPTPAESSKGREEAATPVPAEAVQPFVPPITFRTPVYGSVAMPQPERGEDSRLQESFVKVFPIWCFWPIVGLILIVAGLDLGARSGRRLR